MRIIEEPNDREIHISQLKDGDIAVITGWASCYEIGKIIQKYETSLVVLGSYSGQSFRSGGAIRESEYPECRVRILPKGTKLEI